MCVGTYVFIFVYYITAYPHNRIIETFVDMTMHAISTQMYLNSRTRQYEHVVTIDRMPEKAHANDALYHMVRAIRPPSLSPFHVNSGGYVGHGGYGGSDYNDYYSCESSVMYALRSLTRFGDSSSLMRPSEMPRLFSLLMSDGYVIDTKITRMMNGGSMCPTDQVGSELICYISRQPTVVTVPTVVNVSNVATVSNVPNVANIPSSHLIN